MHPPPYRANEVAKDLQLASWTEGTKVSKDGSGYEYSLSLKSLIWCRTSGKKRTVEKCIKDVHPMLHPFSCGHSPEDVDGTAGVHQEI